MDSLFISADIEKLNQFERESAEAISEFKSIKEEFENVNSSLLETWKGAGANSYKNETDHILEKIGGIEDVLKSINESVIKDIKAAYTKLDEELAEHNKSS